MSEEKLSTDVVSYLDTLFINEKDLLNVSSVRSQLESDIDEAACKLRELESARSSSLERVAATQKRLERLIGADVDRKSTEGKVATILSEIGWPHPSVAISREKIDALRQLVTQLCFLQFQSFLGTHGQPEESIVHAGQLWVVPLLLHALQIRFRYHFDTPGRNTSRPDKPEWFCEFVLRSIRELAPLVNTMVQPGVDRAWTEFLQVFGGSSDTSEELEWQRVPNAPFQFSEGLTDLVRGKFERLMSHVTVLPSPVSAQTETVPEENESQSQSVGLEPRRETRPPSTVTEEELRSFDDTVKFHAMNVLFQFDDDLRKEAFVHKSTKATMVLYDSEESEKEWISLCVRYLRHHYASGLSQPWEPMDGEVVPLSRVIWNLSSLCETILGLLRQVDEQRRARRITEALLGRLLIPSYESFRSKIASVTFSFESVTPTVSDVQFMCLVVNSSSALRSLIENVRDDRVMAAVRATTSKKAVQTKQSRRLFARVASRSSDEAVTFQDWLDKEAQKAAKVADDAVQDLSTVLVSTFCKAASSYLKQRTVTAIVPPDVSPSLAPALSILGGLLCSLSLYSDISTALYPAMAETIDSELLSFALSVRWTQSAAQQLRLDVNAVLSLFSSFCGDPSQLLRSSVEAAKVLSLPEQSLRGIVGIVPIRPPGITHLPMAILSNLSYRREELRLS